MRRAAPALVLVLAALPIGCGGGGADRSTTTTAAPKSPTRAGHRPALPRGWHRAVNAEGGFSFGLPPGWRARDQGAITRVRSVDRGLALTVTADAGGGVAADPRAYAVATLNALTAYTGLTVGSPQGVIDAPYPAASAEATGRLRATGVDQRIVAIALRPPNLGITYGLLAFSSTRRPRSAYDPALQEIVLSFRAG